MRDVLAVLGFIAGVIAALFVLLFLGFMIFAWGPQDYINHGYTRQGNAWIRKDSDLPNGCAAYSITNDHRSYQAVICGDRAKTSWIESCGKNCSREVVVETVKP